MSGIWSGGTIGLLRGLPLGLPVRLATLFPLVSHGVQRLAAGLSEWHYNLGQRIRLSWAPGCVHIGAWPLEAQ